MILIPNIKFVFLNGFSVSVTGLSVFELTGTASLKIPGDHFIIDYFVISIETFMVLSRSVLNIVILYMVQSATACAGPWMDPWL